MAVALLAVGLVVAVGQAGGALGSSSLAAPERQPTSDATVTAGGAGAEAAPSASAGSIRVVARPGDTLWSIVARHAPDEDPRPIVDELVAARRGAPLRAGEIVQWWP